MPNWTDVYIEIKHSDEDMLRKLHKIFDDPNPFNRIKPMPELLYRGNLGGAERAKYGNANWYDWSIENWGTKWDIDGCSGLTIYEDDGELILYVDMMTAWSPPTGVFDTLVSLGFDVKAQFLDEGWMYIGQYDNGETVSWDDPRKAPDELRVVFNMDEMEEMCDE
jgi:hypothetical protein